MASVDDDCRSETPHEADTDELVDALLYGPVKVIVVHEQHEFAANFVRIAVKLVGGSWRHTKRAEWFLVARARERGDVKVHVEPSNVQTDVWVHLTFRGVDNFVRAREILNSLLEG